MIKILVFFTADLMWYCTCWQNTTGDLHEFLFVYMVSRLGFFIHD